MAPFIKDKRYLVGILLVLIGSVLILNNIKFIPNFIPWWVWTWQFLLITIGVFSLLTSDNSGPGIILIGIGSVFLFADILPDIWPGFFDWFVDDSNLFWYLILIVVGLSIILRKRGKTDEARKSRRHSGWSDFHRNEPETGEEHAGSNDASELDYIDEVSIFSGGERIITSRNFKGGKVTAIFGGSDIILTHSQLAPGVNEIEVFAMFGGWTLRVPPNWQIKTEVAAIFGGISDKRYLSADTIRDNSRQLVIKGFVMFGGGEIK